MRLALALPLVLAAGCGAVVYALRPIPDEVERLGPFELITHTHRYLTGYNEGDLRWATTESYSLRYDGEPFEFDGKAGMEGEASTRYSGVNALITFPSAEPAVIVNVGDPNNTSFFYLVRERGGGAVAEYLGQGRGGVSAEWLDTPPEESPAVTDIAVHRGRRSGGRFLLLGQSAVVDVASLKAYPVSPAYGAWVNPFKPPMGLSPDRASFVRWGSASGDAELLVVFDFVSDASYTIPIDRKRMRYNGWEEVDRAWLDHHFEWRPVPGGHERLVVRDGFVPLPYRGELHADEYDPTYLEYELVRVSPEMEAELVGFLEQQLGAHSEGRDAGGTLTLRIGSHAVRVLRDDDEVSVFEDRGGDPSAVRDVARRFDAALATGAYDAFFLP